MSEAPKFDLRIHSEDPEKFREQMEESAEVFWYFSNELEVVKKTVAKLKVEIKRLEANIANELRQEETKISEARIERSLYDYPNYIDVMERFNEAKALEGNLGALVKSLEIRHGLILSFAGMKKREARII